MLTPFVLFLVTTTSFHGVELCCRDRRGFSADKNLEKLESFKNLKNLENIKADNRLVNVFCQGPLSSGNRCCMYLPSKSNEKQDLRMK